MSAILCDGAPRDIEALGFEQVDQRVVGQDFLRVFGGDQRADRAFHRFGRHRVATIGGLDRTVNVSLDAKLKAAGFDA